MPVILNLSKTLLRCNSDDLPDNLVGAVVLYDKDNQDNQIPHAGIIIRYLGESKLFHYTGRDIVLESFDNTELYFYKELTFIDPKLTPSFLTHCEIVIQEAKPQYGYFYTGSLYNENGQFRSPGDLPEFMTCVGFCLNFLKFWLADSDFLAFEDWDLTTVTGDEEFFERFFRKMQQVDPDLTRQQFYSGIRRILPVEFVSGSYSPTIPVGKAFTDYVHPKIEKYLKKVAI